MFPYSGNGQVLPEQHVFLPIAQPIGLNPIDRLYSMQSSYFCGEDGMHVEQ